MKRLLAISWAFPPQVGPRSVQVAMSMDALAASDWRVRVMTTTPRSLFPGSRLDYELSDAYLKQIEVIRVPAPKRYWARYSLRKLWPKSAVVPDDLVDWWPRVAEKALEELNDNAFEALITFGHPWSDHLAGQAIKRATGIRWVAHFSDPWVGNPYNHPMSPAQENRMQELEEGVVRDADALIFTNPATVDFVMDKYPTKWKDKAIVIPHGYDSQTLQGVNPSYPEVGRLQILHSGALYGPRKPDGLLEALRILKTDPDVLKQLRISFQGRIKDLARLQTFIRDNDLADHVRFLAQVSHKESLGTAAAADVLLVIDAASHQESVFLPSKLVNYLMLRKPILGLTPERGVSADLLRRIEEPVAAPDDPVAIAEALRGLVGRWKADGLSVAGAYEQVARQYDIRETTKQLEAVLLGSG